MARLTSEEILAVGRAISSRDQKTARDELSVGEHEVDVIVRVHGVLSVYEDTTKVSTSSLLSEEFLILALRMSGCTRDRSLEIIRGLAEENIGGKVEEAKKARKKMLEEYDPEGAIKDLFREFKESLPRTKVRGKVIFEGAAEAVNTVVKKERKKLDEVA